MTLGTKPTTPCIEWTGSRDKDGYGYGVSRRDPSGESRANRAAWVNAHGQPIPPGMVVMHSCDNPPCVNPDHLRLGTHAENNRDKALKGRAWRAGDAHYNLAKTECKHGHPLEGDNLVVYTNKAGTHRRCRECGRRTSRESMRRLYARRAAASVAALAIVGVAGFGHASTAHAAAGPITLHTTCSGQSVHQQAPYSCTATKIIAGATITTHLTETAAGRLSVTFSMAAPRPVPTPIHVTSHEGNSGAGLRETDPTAVIPAGSTGPVTLVIPVAYCGQGDVKAVFLSRGNGAGRMSGAYINNDTCKVTPPTTSPPTTPISPPATVIRQHPPTSTPSSSGGPSTPSESAPHRNSLGGNLPPTGGSVFENPLFWAAVALVLFGGVGVFFGRRRAAN